MFPMSLRKKLRNFVFVGFLWGSLGEEAQADPGFLCILKNNSVTPLKLLGYAATGYSLTPMKLKLSVGCIGCSVLSINLKNRLLSYLPENFQKYEGVIRRTGTLAIPVIFFSLLIHLPLFRPHAFLFYPALFFFIWGISVDGILHFFSKKYPKVFFY